MDAPDAKLDAQFAGLTRSKPSPAESGRLLGGLVRHALHRGRLSETARQSARRADHLGNQSRFATTPPSGALRSSPTAACSSR